jgi:hypothetical protein
MFPVRLDTPGIRSKYPRDMRFASIACVSNYWLNWFFLINIHLRIRAGNFLHNIFLPLLHGGFLTEPEVKKLEIAQHYVAHHDRRLILNIKYKI